MLCHGAGVAARLNPQEVDALSMRLPAEEAEVVKEEKRDLVAVLCPVVCLTASGLDL